MAALFIGEWVSTKARAMVPSIFVTALIFIIGFWTIFPKNIVEQATFGLNFASICVPLLLVHLGTTMNIRELIEQWKAVAIALLGVCGTILLCLTIGTLLFDWHTVLSAVPSLVGGLVAALLMSENLKAINLDSLAALPIYMLMFHGILGYPLTTILLKKEGNRLKKEFHQNLQAMTGAKEVAERTKVITKIPTNYRTSAFALARTGFVAVLAVLFGTVTNNVINANVVCLIFGIVFCQLGFLEKDILKSAGVFNWLIYGLTAYIFAQLSTTTPSSLLGFIPEILVLIVLSIFGMFLISRLVYKWFGYSKEMAMTMTLTALFGFPADYILTNDVIKEVAENEKEEAYLTAHMMPKMLVGGFATVSIASIIVASVFIKLF